MGRRIKDLLAQRATASFIGRSRELTTLLLMVEGNGQSVAYVYGVGGIGKSSLIEAFAIRARQRHAAVIQLDSRAIEPTERGFLQALNMAVEGQATSAEDAAQLLGTLAERVVLALDTYEVFRLMDTWLRQVFVPTLPENVCVVFSGREPPVPAWFAGPGWQDLFFAFELGPLDEPDAVRVLTGNGIAEEQAHRLNQFAHGHPLALKLAASALAESSVARPELERAALHHVVEELARLYLEDVPDPLTRQALDAASVVRRTTQSLLRAMLPNDAPKDIFERLYALPFVALAHDGLHVQDAMQNAIAVTLQAIDPDRYQAYRGAAWRHLQMEARAAPQPYLWRYTADMLYLIENPVVREAFFPSSSHVHVVEPAQPRDGLTILDISKEHEGPEEVAAIALWWRNVPESFAVVRDAHGEVTGFYCMFERAAVPLELLRSDPVTRQWEHHVSDTPLLRDERALFLRRWLSRDEGESPCSVQAACWLDIKRSYMAMRPHLRRVYLTLRDLGAYAPVAQTLGFRALDQCTVHLDDSPYWTAMLDFGPSSVDGWLAALIAAELGISQESFLDTGAHELVLDGRRVSLTRLEFALLDYLSQREGKAVTRVDLLENVWGYTYQGGSNVVEAAIRALRRKLGQRASVIETVRGTGYRFRR